MLRPLYLRLMFFQLLLVGLAGLLFWLLAIRWDFTEPVALMWVAGACWLVSAVVIGLLLHPLDQVAEALRRLTAGEPAPLGKLPGSDGQGWARIVEGLHAQVMGGSRGPAAGPALPAVLDSLSEGVLILRPDLVPVFTNAALRVMASAAETDALPASGDGAVDAFKGAIHARCFVPDQLAVIEEEMRRHPDRPRTDIIQLERPTQFLRRYSAPLYGAAGAVDGFLVSYQDITREVAQDRLRGDFIANASHELRTPVTSVKLLLENLVDGAKDDPAVRDVFLEDALREIDRMHDLVNDLLDVAALEAGREALTLAAFDVEVVIAEAIETVMPQALRRDVTLALEPGGPTRLEADRTRLRQVLVNLIANAVKFTPAGGRVGVRAWREGEAVRLSVADSGIGIPAKDLPHIFDRFFRVTRNRSRLQGGSGLGLTIVKQAIDAHRGEIHVESTEGQGTTVYVGLPVTQGGGA
ncbi:MAG: ATP-binding protein [Candidatus Sericytochromatia bacterium]|nr:ATP-binding protein [Candidatus Sericytochromatia bacterium]